MVARNLSTLLVLLPLLSEAAPDPLEDALSRWDTSRARLLLSKHGSNLFTTAYTYFLSGDYGTAAALLASKKVLDRDSKRLARLVQDTIRLTRDLVQSASPSGRIIISHPPGRDEAALPYLFEAGEEAYSFLKEALGFDAPTPIRVELVPTLEALARLANAPDASVRSAGVSAICRFGKVIIAAPSVFPNGYPYADAFAHELVHYFLVTRFGERLPAWFQEGVAKYFEPAWRKLPEGTLLYGFEEILAQAMAEGRLLRIEALEGPFLDLGSPDRTALAFAQAASFVAFLVKTYGRHIILTLGEALTASSTDQALQRVTGRTLESLTKAWEAAISPKLSGPPTGPIIFWQEPEQKAFDLLPEEALKALRLGDILNNLGEREAAWAFYKKALDLSPSPHPLVLARLASALNALGRPEEALAFLSRSPVPEDRFFPLARERGLALVSLGRHSEGVNSLLFFVRTNPYDPDVHKALSDAWTALGQGALAERERRLQRLLK